MELHQVRYFLAVADELNFTRAAERCNVAQPSLTRAIKVLEEELGGPLFHRERANTHLSELGRMVKPYLEQALAQSQQAKQQAREFTNLRRSTLKIGIMCTIPPNQLVELICRVQSRHPGIEFEIVDSGAGALEERLIAGDLEVAIYCHPGSEGEEERLHRLPLFREQFCVVLPSGHRLAECKGIKPADLEGVRYLNRANCEMNGFAGPKWREQGLHCETACRSERDDWILAMAASGLGFGFMPASCVNRPDVVARPMVEPEFWREVSLVTVRGRPHSPAVGALVREAMRTNWMAQEPDRPDLGPHGASAPAPVGEAAA